MRAQSRLWLGCFVVALSLSGALAGEADREPTSGGKTVSQWVELLKSQKTDDRFDAAQALAEIGPAAAKAVPGS